MARLLWLPEVLRAAGLTVHEVAGWRTRGADSYGPVRGITCHHTAGSRTSTDAGEISVLINGSTSAPPPIAQLYLSRTGHWHVVASGHCNHNLVGWGGPNEGYGNDSLLGIEAQHSGGTEPWTEVQYRSYVVGVAALVRHSASGYSVTVSRVAGHKEHQPGAKSDPTFDMTRFRADVAAVLAGEDEFMAALSDRDQDALKWRVYSISAGLTTVPDGVVEGEPVVVNQRMLALDAKLAAVLTAVAGADEATAAQLRGEFDQIDSAVAASATASAQRDAELRALLEQHSTGQISAEAVVQALAGALDRGTA